MDPACSHSLVVLCAAVDVSVLTIKAWQLARIASQP
jgi:hypothetical protein